MLIKKHAGRNNDGSHYATGPYFSKRLGHGDPLLTEITGHFRQSRANTSFAGRVPHENESEWV